MNYTSQKAHFVEYTDGTPGISYTLSLDNDFDMVVFDQQNNRISTLPTVTATRMLNGDTTTVGSWGDMDVASNVDWAASDNYTFSNGVLAITAIPEGFTYANFTFTWNIDEGVSLKKTFSLKKHISEVDYNLVVAKTVVNSTYQGGTIRVSINKKDLNGVTIITTGLPSGFTLEGVSTDAKGWYVSYEAEHTEAVTITLKQGNITWDQETIEFVVDGKDGVNGEGEISHYCLRTIEEAPTYPAPENAGYSWSRIRPDVSKENPYLYVVSFPVPAYERVAKKINTHERAFLQKDWEHYGAIGWNENWTIPMGMENSHIVVGDYAYIEGVVTDKADQPVVLYGRVIDIYLPPTGDGHIRMTSVRLDFGRTSGSEVTSRTGVLCAQWTSSPYTISLSNDSATIGTDKDGGGYSDDTLEAVTKTEVTVYEGEENISGRCSYAWTTTNCTVAVTDETARTAYLTGLSDNNASATVTVTYNSNSKLIGTKTFSISKNKQGATGADGTNGIDGADAVTYKLSVLPNSFNLSTYPAGVGPSFVVTRYEGSSITTMDSSKYVIKVGNNVYDGANIKETTTFDLYINNNQVDSETVTMVESGKSLRQITQVTKEQTYDTIMSWVGKPNDTWSGITVPEFNPGDTCLIAITVTDRDDAVGYMRCEMLEYKKNEAGVWLLHTNNLDFMLGPTGPQGSQGIQGTKTESIRVYYTNNASTPPTKPTTDLGFWRTTEPELDSSNPHLWSCTGTKTTTYSSATDTTNGVTKYNNDWTTPELYKAYTTNTNIDPLNYATFLRLSNFKETENTFYDNDGKMYINASLMNVDSLLVNNAFSVAINGGRKNLALQDGVSIYANPTDNPAKKIDAATCSWELFCPIGAGTGICFPARFFEKEKYYTLKFYIKPIEGELTSVAGHSNCAYYQKFYINGIEQKAAFVTGASVSPALGEELECVLIFQFIASGSDDNLYIQPNRGNNYDTACRCIISNITLYEGKGSYDNIITKINADQQGVSIQGNKIDFTTSEFVIKDIANNTLFAAYGEDYTGGDGTAAGTVSIAGWRVNGNSLYKQITSNNWTYKTSVSAPSSLTENAFSVIRTNTSGTSITAFSVNGQGAMVCTSGEIAGWAIRDGTLYSGAGDNKVTLYSRDLYNNENAITIGNSGERKDWRIIAGNNFGVTSDGSLYASAANITGTITATSGSIANQLDFSATGITGKAYYHNDSSRKRINVGLCPGSNGNRFRYEDKANNTISLFVGVTSITEPSSSGNGTVTANFMVDWTGNTTIKNLHATSFTQDSSDVNKKNTINNLEEVHSQIFNELRPVSFKYNDGESDRLHFGFIAQEVEQTVLDVGLTTKEFGAVCYDINNNGEKYNYRLRYEEFISLCVAEIQKLKPRVSTLEQTILNYETRISSLEAQIQNLTST